MFENNYDIKHIQKPVMHECSSSASQACLCCSLDPTLPSYVQHKHTWKHVIVLRRHKEFNSYLYYFSALSLLLFFLHLGQPPFPGEYVNQLFCFRFCLFIQLFIDLSIYLSISFLFYLFIYPFIFIPIHSFSFLYIYLIIYSFIYLVTFIIIHLFLSS